MATASAPDSQRGQETTEDDSPVAVLRGLEAERGGMFSEAEFQQMRAAVLQELAHGARLRPFTWFTFAVVALGLLAAVILGLTLPPGRTAGDYALAMVSAIALAAFSGFVRNCLRSIRQDALRSLDSRLAELDELRDAKLISTEEYQRLQARILIARQRGS